MIPKRKSATQLCRELEDRLWAEAASKSPVIKGPWKKNPNKKARRR